MSRSSPRAFSAGSRATPRRRNRAVACLPPQWRAPRTSWPRRRDRERERDGARLTYARAPRGRMSASPATVTNFASRSSSVPRSPPSSRASVLPRDRSMERVGAEHARASRVALEPGGRALLRCDERGRLGERTRNIVGWARANIADLRISDLARFFQRFGFSGVYDIPVGYILAFSHKKTTEKKEPRR